MNLGLLLRKVYGVGTPRGLQGLSHALDFLTALITQYVISQRSQITDAEVTEVGFIAPLNQPLPCANFGHSKIKKQTSTPDC